MNITCVFLSVGDGGDQFCPPDSGLHVLLQRHHQRERQRRTQDLLCAHGDDSLAVPGERYAIRQLRHHLYLHRRDKQTLI